MAGSGNGQGKWGLVKREEAAPTSLVQLKGQGLTLEEEVELSDAIRGSWSKRTMKAYEADWKDFLIWCAQREPVPQSMPASPYIIAAFLQACADRGKKAATVSRRAAAIATRHRLEGHPNPCATIVVSRALSGIRRKLGVHPNKRRPLVFDVLKKAVATCNVATNRGLRDRALLLLGYATALRRENLVQLCVSDVTYTPEGLTVFVARGKTDQEGAGRLVGVVKSGGKLCAVEAVKAWIAKLPAQPIGGSSLSFALFRSISRDDKIRPKAMSTDGVADMVKRTLKKAGIDPARYAAHSMRAGHATQAARAGAMPQEIMELGGWKRLDTVMGYIREADPTRHTSASKIWPKDD